MIWLALNIVITGLLAIAASMVIMLLVKALKLKYSRMVGSVMAIVITVVALFALMKLLMQFTHVAPAAGSLHLALGCLVAFFAAPASFGWLDRRKSAGA